VVGRSALVPSEALSSIFAKGSGRGLLLSSNGETTFSFSRTGSFFLSPSVLQCRLTGGNKDGCVCTNTVTLFHTISEWDAEIPIQYSADRLGAAIAHFTSS
jgi:hypothetical protein